MMKIKIENIKVGNRIRLESTNVIDLKESIQKVGMLNPIIINENNELVSGYRRLAACTELGWTEIDAIVMEVGSDEIKKLDIEYHENIGRQNLKEDDILHYRQTREELLNPPKPKNKILTWMQNVLEKVKNLFRRIVQRLKDE